MPVRKWPVGTGKGTWLGIDPGRSGSLAWIDWRGTFTFPFANATRRQIWETVRGIKINSPDLVAVIEKVGGYVGGGEGEKGGGAANGSAMFKFGVSYGELLMALTAADIKSEEVPPQVWQKALGITPKRKKTKAKKGERGSPGETRTEFKRRLRQHAESLFPGIVLTNDTADSLLIVEFCRRKHTGILTGNSDRTTSHN